MMLISFWPAAWTRFRISFAVILLAMMCWFSGGQPVHAQGPSDDASRLRHGPAVDSENRPLTAADEQRAHSDFLRTLQARRPAQVQTAQTIKVLVLDFNPLFGGDPLSKKKGWNSPDGLMSVYNADVAEASHGNVGFQINAPPPINGYPVKTGGFVFNNDTYDGCFNDSSPSYCSSMIDYGAVLNTVYDAGVGSACSAIGRGDVDEVWLWGGPYFGYWEYVITSPRTLCPGVGTVFTVMGFNYQVTDAEMLHDLGHRAEEVLRSRLGDTTWDRFDGQRSRYAKDSPSDCDASGANPALAGLDVLNTHAGNVHFPPNAICHYQYNRNLAVASDADDWSNYPDLTGAQTTVNSATWVVDTDKYQRGFMLWWFAHMPHSNTTSTSNWWPLLFERIDFPFATFFPLIRR